MPDLTDIEIAKPGKYFTHNGALYNTDGYLMQYCGALSATSFIVPDEISGVSITGIMHYAFAEAKNITAIKINNIGSIGNFAFDGCVNLTKLYILSLDMPETKFGTFADLNHCTLYVPQKNYTLYDQDFKGDFEDIDFIEINVTLNNDGQETAFGQRTYYGQEINGLNAPSKTGYEFIGWNDKEDLSGRYYRNGDIWDVCEDITLYAKWSPMVYKISFVVEGCETPDSIDVTYDAPVGELPVVGKTGYDFIGWYYDNGTPYKDVQIWQQANNVRLTAQFRAKTYTITYHGNGGTPAKNSDSVAYNSQLGELPTANRDGYVFTHWNTKSDGSGNTLKALEFYTIDGDTDLYAQYKAKTYNVILNNHGGTGETSVNAVYGAQMPAGLTPPVREGYEFLGYYKFENGGDTQYYDEEMHSVNIFDLTSEENTLHAHWKAKVYTVTLVNDYGENLTAEATYGEHMPTAAIPQKTGYIFQGYFEKPNGIGTKYYNEKMESAARWDKTDKFEIYAHWAAGVYYISLQYEGGRDGTPSVSATYDAPMPSGLKPPVREGYTFKGYFLNRNGKGYQYYNENMDSVRNLDSITTDVLYAHWEGRKFTVNLNNGGYGGTSEITATYGSPMPTATAPTRDGYTFIGYFDEENGGGKKYYDGPYMISVHDWDKLNDNVQLYAFWDKIYYTVTLRYPQINRIQEVKVAYGEMMPYPDASNYVYSYTGYEFVGIYDAEDGKGTEYYSMEITTYTAYDTHTGLPIIKYREGIMSERTWDKYRNGDLYAYYKLLEIDYTYENVKLNEGNFDETSTVHLRHGEKATITAKQFKGYTFSYFCRNYQEYKTSTVTWDITLSRSDNDGKVYPDLWFYAVYTKNKCVAEGTLITLADGSQVPVQKLTGNEMLLVWNLKTGKFDSAPIMYIDSDPAAYCEVINLYFSDGTAVKVIDEHAFWDVDLNKYIYLREDAANYIGHWFNKQCTDIDGNMTWTKVKLVRAEIKQEYTSTWSPITYGHFCYYVNGMLSMPGATQGFINIFDVDAATMKYNEEAYNRDIETYGLYTYEEFNSILPISETVFNAFNGQYLKISIGKGLTDIETVKMLAERSAGYLENMKRNFLQYNL